MILDLDRFAINRKFIQTYYREKGGDPEYAVSLMAATILCPIIVLAFYLAEDIGFTPELIKTIDYQMTRGYTVINQPQNSPYLYIK